MATDYDFSDEFVSAQYLPPGRGPILIGHNSPPPPDQPLLQSLLYEVTPQLSTDTITIFVILVLTSVFCRYCRALISDCCKRRVAPRTVWCPFIYGLILFVVIKGIWDVRMLRAEFGEVYRALNMCVAMATMPPERGMGILGRWIHEDG